MLEIHYLLSILDQKEEEPLASQSSTISTSSQSAAQCSTSQAITTSAPSSSSVSRVQASATLNDDSINIHPRKRKHQRHQRQEVAQQAKPSEPSTSGRIQTTDMGENSYSLFLGIRKQVSTELYSLYR